MCIRDSIVDGPLEGFIGTVEELDVEKNRIRVVVSMFGRDTPCLLYTSEQFAELANFLCPGV